MNKIVFILLAFSSLVSAESFPITEVTVYRAGATVLRTDDVSLAAGDNVIEINGLPYNLDLATTQVFLDPSIKVLSMRTENDNSYQTQLGRMSILQDSVSYYTMEEKMILEQLQILKQNNKLPQQIKTDYATELKNLLDYYTKETKRLNSELLIVQNGKQYIQTQITLLQSETGPSELGSIVNRKKIILKLQSDKALSTELGLSYLVRQAGWSTEYDLYMTGLEDDLSLDYKGKVWNSTNEDWSDVKLTLTTAQPSMNIAAPELTEWWLREINHYRNKGRASYNESIHTNVRAYAEEEMMDDKSGVVSKQKKVAEYSEQITASVFELNRLHTIRKQTSDYTVVLSEQEIEANYYYKCTPKLSPYAYLYATINNVSDLVLSKGYLTVFAQGRMQGKTYFDPNKETEKLEIPLGVDYGVAIERDRIKDYSDINFLRSKVKKEIGYEISVRNNKSTEIHIEIQDQIPLSTGDKIVVRKVEVGDAEVIEEEGRVTWKVKINPNQYINRTIKYEVEQPKGVNLGV